MNRNHGDLDALVDYYTTYILSYSKQTRLITLGCVTACVLLCRVIYNINRPPPQLRHLPYISYFDLIKSILMGESVFELRQRKVLPIIDKANGLYLQPMRSGWTLFSTNPGANKAILTQPDRIQKKQGLFGSKFSLVGRWLGGNNLATLEGEHWRRHRRVANPAFHRTMPIKLFGQLAEKMFLAIDTAEPIEVTEITSRVTLDAIGIAGFGFDFRAITDADNEWVTAYKEIKMNIVHPFFGVFQSFDHPRWFWLFRKRAVVHQHMTKLLTLLDGMVQQKRKFISHMTDDDEKDLLTLMIEAEKNGEGYLSDEELRTTICGFFLAGHDTTANTLAAIIYRLAVNQDAQRKARAEVEEILGSAPENVIPNVDQLKQLKYTLNVIKEALRMHPPIFTSLSRRLMEDTVLAGHVIPKNTLVQADIITTQRNPQYWDDPEAFEPDRFQVSESTKNAEAQGLVWSPFGYGSHQCIGMNFSLMEQRVILAMLLRKYEWTLPPNTMHKTDLRTFGYGIAHPKNVYIQFKARY
ncbi:cytochrome P450 [Radiomyces spectabilis]|uniref:cytochrome P450 n=1 Tax=Radiomyces spectabilis TaxID=64574 RepID=UPI00221E6BF4|nr:cytochrome P450 [Radiomyces spectabilis]KAI8381241.1 cytochrome P450 [Radiomyces spectabilis]